MLPFNDMQHQRTQKVKNPQPFLQLPFINIITRITNKTIKTRSQSKQHRNHHIHRHPQIPTKSQSHVQQNQKNIKSRTLIRTQMACPLT